jgi:hypothetical protein
MKKWTIIFVKVVLFSVIVFASASISRTLDA